jgi:hypothetical protein
MAYVTRCHACKTRSGRTSAFYELEVPVKGASLGSGGGPCCDLLLTPIESVVGKYCLGARR